MINNWDQSYPADTIKSISTIKLDHNFTASGKLSGYYSRYWGPHYNGSDGLPIPITEGAKVRDLDRHGSRHLRLGAHADDTAQQPRRIRAPLESGFRAA